MFSITSAELIRAGIVCENFTSMRQTKMLDEVLQQKKREFLSRKGKDESLARKANKIQTRKFII
jgi:hypothetical protein